MAKKIFKYELPTFNDTLDFPADSRLMRVGANPANQSLPCLWVEVDDELPATEKHVFKVYGTGQVIHEPEEERHYVGTAICGAFVWHVFEVPTEEALKAEREYRAAVQAQMDAHAQMIEAAQSELGEVGDE